MRYSVLGFNQALAVQSGLDLTDLLILQYVKDACVAPKMLHIMEDNVPLVWLQHDKLLEDIPIINISEGTLKNRLTGLRAKGFLASKQVANNKGRGSRTYYGMTELTMSLIYDPNTTTSFENDLKTRPRHFKMTSDNLLNNNKELDNTLSKDKVTNASIGISLDIDTKISSDNLTEYEQHMYSEDVVRKRNANNKGAQARSKKPSLWDKCAQIIDDYTQNEELKEALIAYLKVRLAIKDKPIYTPMWKALLAKLDTFPEEDRVGIVRQSAEQGYASFYELRGKKFSTTRTGRSREADLKVFSETEDMGFAKVSDEYRERIIKNGQIF